MPKLAAIKYLIENSKYSDEWTGTGMWEAVEEVMKTTGTITKVWLDKLLEKAENK